MQLTQGNIVQKLLERIPEIIPEYEKELTWWDEVLPYVVFGDVLIPFLEDLLKSDEDNSNILSKIFVFVEDMAMNGELYVQQLLTTTVLERIGDSVDLLQKAKPYFGGKTKQLFDEIEKYIGRK